MIIKVTSVFSRGINILCKPIATFEILFLILLHVLNLRSYFIFLSLFLLYQLISEIISQGEKEQRLNSLTEKDSKVMVIRRDSGEISKKQIIDSKELVPGDLIEITNEMIVPADVVLLYGSCVIQECVEDSNF